jgi:Microsomal signal peptidase 25 kDa subunit (SPC25)
MDAVWDAGRSAGAMIGLWPGISEKGRKRVDIADQIGIKAQLDESICTVFLAEEAEDDEWLQGTLGPLNLCEEHKSNTIRLILGFLAVACVGFSLVWSWMTENNPQFSGPTGYGVLGFFTFSTLMQLSVFFLDSSQLTICVFDPKGSAAKVEKLPGSKAKTLATQLLAKGLSEIRTGMARHDYAYEIQLVSASGETTVREENVGEFFTAEGDFVEEKFRAVVEATIHQFISAKKNN